MFGLLAGWYCARSLRKKEQIMLKYVVNQIRLISPSVIDIQWPRSVCPSFKYLDHRSSSRPHVCSWRRWEVRRRGWESLDERFSDRQEKERPRNQACFAWMKMENKSDQVFILLTCTNWLHLPRFNSNNESGKLQRTCPAMTSLRRPTRTLA